jgi:hypothetical protein
MTVADVNRMTYIMMRDAALLIGLGLLTVGYWDALGWMI